jgi:HTH-type transcriptional regulator/antitoxin HigA
MTTESNTTLDLAHLQAAWESLATHLPLGPIGSEADYDARVRLLDRLLDAVGGDEDHPLLGVLDLLSTQIERYEEAHYPLPEATPHEVLRYLMEEHGLSQREIAADLGGQSVVSDVLHGKRQLNARQIRALATRFHVSPAVFF